MRDLDHIVDLVAAVVADNERLTAALQHAADWLERPLAPPGTRDDIRATVRSALAAHALAERDVHGWQPEDLT